jgi:hypothetical protein
VVQLEFANGVHGVFTVMMDQPRTTRLIRIYGTEGQIHGDLREDEVEVVTVHDEGYEEIHHEVIPVIHDGSGHHGGDSTITEQFKAMLRGRSGSPPAGLREGIEASLVCFAAEESRHNNTVVRVDEMRKRVFGNSAQGSRKPATAEAR